MLRRALDEAEHHEKEQQERYRLREEANNDNDNGSNTENADADTDTEGSALISSADHQRYGAIASTSRDSSDLEGDGDYDDDEEEEENDDDDDEYLTETDDDDDDDWEAADRDANATENPRRRFGSAVIRCWTLARGCFAFVVNVENVWDSPTPMSLSRHGSGSNGGSVVGRRKKYVIVFWFVVLAVAYTTERVSYKLLVDQSGPFRLLAVQMVVLMHAVLAGLGMLLSAISARWECSAAGGGGSGSASATTANAATLPMRPSSSFSSLGIPVVDVGLMALIDTVQMLLVFLTGYHVAPTLIVILIQFTIPLTALLSQLVHPDGHCKMCGEDGGPDDDGEGDGDDDEMGVAESSATTSRESSGGSNRNRNHTHTHRNHNNSNNNNSNNRNRNRNAGRPMPGWGGLSVEHLLGSVVISVAVLLALFPSIYTLVDKDFFRYASPTEIPTQTAFNTILFFVSSCLPAAASQLYKEYVFLRYKQPVRHDHLNFVLSVFQLIFASIVSPLVYTLLGFAASEDWTELYPSSEFSKNFAEGLQCFFGVLDDETAKNGYYDEASCGHLLSLAVLYSFSVICVVVAVDKIVNGGATRVMYRGVSAGIILSVISLYAYDLNIPDFNYGAAIDSLNLVCLILLVVGSEIYHRVSLQDASFETVYPEIESFFDDIEE